MNSSWLLALIIVLSIGALGCLRSYRRIRAHRSRLIKTRSTDPATSGQSVRLNSLERLVLRLLLAQSDQGRSSDASKNAPPEQTIPSFEESERLLKEEEPATSLESVSPGTSEIFGKEPLASHNAQFTVYRPKTLIAATWQTLLAFAHLVEPPVDGRKDRSDPLREVQAQAEAILGQSLQEYQKLVQDSAQLIPPEGELCFAPEAEGIEFNPPRRNFIWQESVHLEVFLVRASAALAGHTIRGRLLVFLGNLLIGEIPLNFSVRTGGERAEAGDSMEVESGRRYRRIFASYSHKDEQLVGEFQRYAKTLGDDYLRDVSSLRAGEDWNERLMELIRTADVFQLFWSWNSIDSTFVRQEYEYAARLGRENFIRPVYWEDPLPSRPERNLPPEELRRFHFHRLVTQTPAPKGRRSDAEHPVSSTEHQEVAKPEKSQPTSAAKRSAGLPSTQKFIARIRSPRVQIDYDLEKTYGAEKRVELPFIIGVLADLSGKAATSPSAISDRKFLEVDFDNFDERLRSFLPRVRFAVPNRLTGQGNLEVDLTFERLDDFSPAAVAKKLEGTRQVLATREAIFGSDIAARVAELDRKLSEQIKLIIHHEDFKALEGTWRGLHYLVTNTETDEKLKIRVMNISKKDAGRTLRKFKGTAWDQSPLFKKIYEEEYGTPGGAPYGCLIGDYAFDHTPPDVEMLLSISQICSASHTPFIAAAAPTLMNMDTWQELMDPRDLTKLFQTPEYASWRSLRDSEDSRYIGLTMPKTLSRLPYGAKTNPVEDFDFEEDTEGADHAKYCWSNAVYAMGANINRAFKLHGWCARIRGSESGGMVEELPMHTFPTDDGGVDMKCPTEIAITDRREAELANAGLMPLSHLNNTDYAVFVSAQSLHKPQVYDDPEATANDNFASRLPYLFAMCRFAHYLKCIVRDRIGRFQSTDDLTRFLNSWLALFVCSDRNASEHVRAQYPLGQAEIHDAIVDDTSGQVTATFIAWPRFQLEGLTQPLRLRMKFPVLLSQ